jgi:hypothetical protein
MLAFSGLKRIIMWSFCVDIPRITRNDDGRQDREERQTEQSRAKASQPSQRRSLLSVVANFVFVRSRSILEELQMQRTFASSRIQREPTVRFDECSYGSLCFTDDQIFRRARNAVRKDGDLSRAERKVCDPARNKADVRPAADRRRKRPHSRRRSLVSSAAISDQDRQNIV